MEKTDYGWALNTDTGHVFPANHLTLFEGNVVHYTPTKAEKASGQREATEPYIVAHGEDEVQPESAAVETVFDMKPEEEPASLPSSSPAPPPGVTIATPPAKKRGRPKGRK